MGKLVNAEQVVHRQAAARASRAERAGSLAARRPHRAGRRADSARREDRCRSRSRAAQPDAGARDVVVLQSQFRAWIALALVAGGRARHGETLWAVSPLADAKVRVKVGPPTFIDPDGERLRA